MKKNTMMRLASVLLIAVLMSTCAISGTFAKYVTSGDSSDSARVAKFGVEVTADFSNMFTATYKTHDAWDGDYPALESVVAYNGTDNLVAPGTDGTLAHFDISGMPEVDVAVTYEANLSLENWTIGVGGEEYCPIVFTVNGVEYDMDTYTTVAALEQAVEEAIVKAAAKYNANTNLEVVEDDLNVSWKWHFEGENVRAGATGPAMQTDVKDTALGDQAAFTDDSIDAATITLEVKCTVTQID